MMKHLFRLILLLFSEASQNKSFVKELSFYVNNFHDKGKST